MERITTDALMLDVARAALLWLRFSRRAQCGEPVLQLRRKRVPRAKGRRELLGSGSSEGERRGLVRE